MDFEIMRVYLYIIPNKNKILHYVSFATICFIISLIIITFYSLIEDHTQVVILYGIYEKSLCRVSLNLYEK